MATVRECRDDSGGEREPDHAGRRRDLHRRGRCRGADHGREQFDPMYLPDSATSGDSAVSRLVLTPPNASPRPR
jgi:hypothetical protein